MEQRSPSERQRALFALGATAIGLAREGAIRPADLAAVMELLQALIEADGYGGRPGGD